MAPLGFSCTKALLATGLLLWLAPATLLAVQQPQPVLFVEPSTPVDISCILDETLDGKGNVFWFQRLHGERPRLILSCDQEAQGEFSCEYMKGRAVLHIAAAGTNHTGLYLCAYNIISWMKFGNGTALIVGGGVPRGTRGPCPHRSPPSPCSRLCRQLEGPELGAGAGAPRLPFRPPRPGLCRGQRQRPRPRLLAGGAPTPGGAGAGGQHRAAHQPRGHRRGHRGALRGALQCLRSPRPQERGAARGQGCLHDTKCRGHGRSRGAAAARPQPRRLLPPPRTDGTPAQSPGPSCTPAAAGRADVRPAPLCHPSEGSAVTTGLGPKASVAAPCSPGRLRLPRPPGQRGGRNGTEHPSRGLEGGVNDGIGPQMWH